MNHILDLMTVSYRVVIVTLIGLAVGLMWVAAPVAAAPEAPTGITAPRSKHDSTGGTRLAQTSATPSNDVAQTIGELRRELNEQRARTEQLEDRLDTLEKQQQTQQQQHITQPGLASTLKTRIGHGAEVTPGAPNQQTEADIYSNGFYLKSRTGRFSMYFNGLFQPRFTFFKPNSVAKFGENNSAINNFDVWLGRFAISGNAFDPTIKYFLQIEGTTTGNSTSLSMLDWFMSKTFNPLLTVQAGRYWTVYTYEYYDPTNTYLLPDLSAAEYAFTLGRQEGTMITGQIQRLTYNFSVSSNIPGLDVGPVQNFNSKLAYTANLQYDILAPYGYKETDPSLEGATRPELSLWAATMYNPVQYNSTFSNEMAGDRTYGANAQVNFRYRYLTFQGVGYYRRTREHLSLPTYDSWGFGEQAGYYLIPGKLELAERVSGIWWGQPEIPTVGGTENNWWSGPSDFPYKSLTEYTAGINYYLYGNNAKLQLAYSYLAGRSWSNTGFGANRLFVQSTLKF